MNAKFDDLIRRLAQARGRCKRVVALITLLGTLGAPGVFAQIPQELTAEWVANTPGSRPKLTWRAPASSAFSIQRTYGGQGAWTNLSSPSISTDPEDETLYSFTDTGLSHSVLRYYHYRVQITGSSAGPAEVAITGNASLAYDSAEKDSDADGIPDEVEKSFAAAGTNPHDFQDWTDGTGDADGDGVPNAWEYALSGSAAMRDPDAPPPPHCTVNPALPIQTATYPRNYHTITAAIGGLPSVSGSHPTDYRIIRVSPGIYEETLSVTSARHVAIVPDRGDAQGSHTYGGFPAYDPRAHWEIRGTHASNPVVSVADSTLVLEGFVLTRAANSAGPVVRVTESGYPGSRFYITRLVNCLISNNNTGSAPVVEQHRSRLVLAHCTLFMNGAGAVSTAYGAATGAMGSTSRLRVHNSILWNPVNTTIPEVEAFGDVRFVNTIMHYRQFQMQPGIPEAPDPVESVVTAPMLANPVLTPLGYLVGPAPPASPEGDWQLRGAMGLGAPDLHVMRDMHGELRRPAAPDLGPQQWYDDDEDSIPNFADTLNLADVEGETLEDKMAAARENASWDKDFDGIDELSEYLYGTDKNNADTYFLSVHQAVRMFLPSDTSFYTREETDALFYNKSTLDTYFLTKSEAHTLYRPRAEVIRVQPGGDISMGSFTEGTPP